MGGVDLRRYGVAPSIHHFISSHPLRMINALGILFLKQNVNPPNRMEINAGKPSHHSLFKPFTFKHCMSTIMKCITTKQK